MAGTYLQITLKIETSNRAAAAEVYRRFRDPFLKTIAWAVSKELLVRGEDVQVLHGFHSEQHTREYLQNDLFCNDVAAALKPHLSADPEVRIYSVAGQL